MATGSRFRSTVQQLREQAGTHNVLVVDLERLEFIDSFGVESLVQIEADVAAEGGRMVLVPGPPHVHRVFRLLGCHAAFEVAPVPESPVPSSGVRKSADPRRRTSAPVREGHRPETDGGRPGFDRTDPEDTRTEVYAPRKEDACD